jgi:hypothetical protein
MLTNRSLITFQKLYLDEYGERLSTSDARELGNNLVSLYRAVYSPNNTYYPENSDEKEN